MLELTIILIFFYSVLFLKTKNSLIKEVTQFAEKFSFDFIRTNEPIISHFLLNYSDFKKNIYTIKNEDYSISNYKLERKGITFSLNTIKKCFSNNFNDISFMLYFNEYDNNKKKPLDKLFDSNDGFFYKSSNIKREVLEKLFELNSGVIVEIEKSTISISLLNRQINLSQFKLYEEHIEKIVEYLKS